jgi:hypothetical protein
MRSICEMKAVVFHKPKDMRVESVEDPSLEDPRGHHLESYLYRDLRIGLAHVQRVYAAAQAVGYGP